MNANVIAGANYGLELVDALTGGPLVGRSAVIETSSQQRPYLVNASRWVFTALPAATANFAITSRFYMNQIVTTGAALPDPAMTGPGHLATILMTPRTGYPFPPTLTRVVGLVRLDPSIDPSFPPVPNATVTLTPTHSAPPAAPVNDPAVILQTSDDGQFTFWFLPLITEAPPIANQVTGSVIDGAGHSGSFSLLNLLPNGVTNAPTVLLK